MNPVTRSNTGASQRSGLEIEATSVAWLVLLK